jgi:hypothetical protein
VQVQSLETELAELRAQLETNKTAWQKERKRFESSLAAAQQGDGSSAGTNAELERLREENKQLETWLAEMEEKAKHGATGGGEGGEEMDDLRRRFEMAVQDVRELKTKNAELTEQLARKGGSGGAPAGGGGQDWESLKQRMLAQLESDFEEGDETQKADKLTVQGAIKITDQALAEKDQELAEMRKVLESQSKQVGEVAVGAAAFSAVIDADELIKQEREVVKQLQDKLRKAEVDLSLERAKLAREKQELEEKARSLENERAVFPNAGDSAGGEKGKKASGRKWLTRLGLGDGKGE